MAELNHIPEVYVEKHNQCVVAWCKTIFDESFLRDNTKLSTADLQKLSKIQAPNRRCEWLCVRWLLQRISPTYFEIRYHESGKPYVHEAPFSISISHCNDIVCIVINESGGCVGVDCEQIAQRVVKVKHKFLTAQETILAAKNELLYSTIIWSAKEALYKLYEIGEIDFKEHLHVGDFEFNPEGGTFTGNITKNGLKTFLMNYKLLNNTILVWATE